MGSPFADAVIAEMADIVDGGLSPGQFTAISKAIASDAKRLGRADILYFVIGNYDTSTGQKDRVEGVRDALSTPNATEAFLLEEIDRQDDAWENWYTKFLVFNRRADYVVGVFEDNDGGHELEAGEVDNVDLYILKRDYFDESGQIDTSTEHERFDGMLAMLFRYLDDREQLYRWSMEGQHADDLIDAASRLLADTS